jgi:leader peptidase (prepilin peptidase)/N-methyltransferase
MLVSIILSLILTGVGTRWINSLYQMPNAPLTFPADIVSRSKFRPSLMFLLMFFSILKFSETPLPQFFYITAIIFFLTMITFTDFEQYTIFNKMLLPFGILGILAAIHLNLPLADRIIAAIVGGGIFLIIAFVSSGGIGGGDVKLVFVLGLWLGSKMLINVVFIASIFGGFVAIILLATKQMSRKSFFAYGPYFTLTTLVMLAFVEF